MSTNEITGDALRTKPATDAYRANYDAIFKREPTPNPDWPEEADARIDIVGQNGNTGDHYDV